jgi:hypothetical protein
MSKKALLRNRDERWLPLFVEVNPFAQSLAPITPLSQPSNVGSLELQANGSIELL